MRRALAVLLLTALAGCALAARQTPFLTASSEDLPGTGLSAARTSLATIRALLPGGLQKKSDESNRKEEDTRGYVIVRFWVPPSESDDFEKEWLKLEKEVDKDERENIMFTLSKTKLDNLQYMSYGEWETHRDMHDHMMSDHFGDFAEWVDDHGIRWQMELLKNMSEDIEEEEEEVRKGNKLATSGEQDQQDQQGGQGDWDDNIPEEYRHYIPDQYRPSKQHKREHSSHRKSSSKRGHGRRVELSDKELAALPVGASEEQVSTLYSSLTKRKDKTHVAITYMVPPGEADGFHEAWLDMAEDTVKEKGNVVYSLRKVATDNTRFYAYGMWDSMRDYLDHLESKHMDKFLGAVDEHDVVWFIQPLESISNE